MINGHKNDLKKNGTETYYMNNKYSRVKTG